jgi:hypothetical protein
VTGTGSCTPGAGSGGVSDYSLIFKYENTDEDFEAGINLIKRLGGASQDPNSGVQTPPGTLNNGVATVPAGSMNFLTYDLFARKKLNTLTLGVEVPITSGTLAASTYSTFAVAGEADWKPSDSFEMMLKTGYAPGQDSSTSDYKAFYFNPNYHIAMIMFNYQLANFAGPQTQNNPNLSRGSLASPYDNPIVDAQYLSLASHFKPWDKWTIRPNLAYAVAPKTAANGQSFYNYWTRTMQVNQSGKSQGSSLGWEFDLGLTFQWDEYFQFSWDNGVFFPGSFYAFSNTPTDNATSAVFATSVRVGVNF